MNTGSFIRCFATNVQYYLFEGMHLVRYSKGNYALKNLKNDKWMDVNQLAFKIETNSVKLKDEKEAQTVLISLKDRVNMKKNQD